MMKRSNEPVFWSLFGAGGVVAAFILPVLIFVTGIAVPLDILPASTLGYDRILAFTASWTGRIFIFTVISFPLWHGAHRIFLSLHDLGIHSGLLFYRWLCYGLAAMGSLVTLGLLIII